MKNAGEGTSSFSRSIKDLTANSIQKSVFWMVVSYRLSDWKPVKEKGLTC